MPISEEAEARLRAMRAGGLPSSTKVPAWMNRPPPVQLLKVKKAKAARRSGDDSVMLDSSPDDRRPEEDALPSENIGEPADRSRKSPQADLNLDGKDVTVSPLKSPARPSSRPPSPPPPDKIIDKPGFQLLTSEETGGSAPPKVPPTNSAAYPAGLGKSLYPHYGNVFQGRPSASRRPLDNAENPHTDSELGDDEMSPLPDQVEEFLGDPRDPETMKQRAAKLLRKHGRMLMDLNMQVRRDREAAEDRHAVLMECARLRQARHRDQDEIATTPEVHIARMRDYAYLMDREGRLAEDNYNSRAPPRSGSRGGGRWKWLPHDSR